MAGIQEKKDITALKDLIAISLEQKSTMDKALDPGEWKALLKAAEDQAVIGVLSAGLNALDKDQDAPLGIYAQWMLRTEIIQKNNARQKERIRELAGILEEKGIRFCLLKGQGMAEYYPAPDLRQCGDIDIWVEGSREDTLALFKSLGPVGNVVYHHFDSRLFSDTELEVHFMPSWMNDPFTNARLQKFFRENAGMQFADIDSGLGCARPQPAFDAVYCVIHIFRHLFDEGVGMRQLMDCHFLLNALPQEEKAPVLETLRKLKLGKFTAALMYTLRELFGTEDRLLLCEPDPEAGERFLREVILAGNFGRADSRNAHAADETTVGRARRKLSRLAGFLRDYPTEVLWAPCFKTWQLIWRRRHKYFAAK